MKVGKIARTAQQILPAAGRAGCLPLQFSSPDHAFGTEKIPALNASAPKDENGAVHILLVSRDSKNAFSLETAPPGVH